MNALKRSFCFQFENNKRELLLNLGVLTLIWFFLVPITNLIVWKLGGVSWEQWISKLVGLYEVMLPIGIINFIYRNYYHDYAIMKKLGITRKTFVLSTFLSMFINLVVMSLSFAVLGKVLSWIFKREKLSYLLQGSMRELFNYNLIEDSFGRFFLIILFYALFFYAIWSIFALFLYRYGVKYWFFFIVLILVEGTIIYLLMAQGALLYKFSHSSLWFQGLISIGMYLVSNYISGLIVQRLDITG